ncbi:hypothetical protein P3G55_10000 [Leptospira sp. 96542]|nr:hypothetical protein [Leptospira sp. 96542]
MKTIQKIIDHPLFAELITLYQKSLKQRYEISALERYPKYASIPRETINKLILFFTNFLYPKYDERIQLDRAFDSLSGFVHNPSKVWGILGNLAASIFKFGRHFPLALKAGMRALHAYVTAHEFESFLVNELSKETNPKEILENPYGMEKIISGVKKEQADQFRKDIGELFSVFTDSLLVNKIILIMEDIVKRMETKGTLYTEEDKNGIRLGVRILKEGQDIFKNLRKEEISLILQAIDEVERDFYLSACERFSH